MHLSISSSQQVSTLRPQGTCRDDSSELSELQRVKQKKNSLLPKLLTQVISDRTRANRLLKKKQECRSRQEHKDLMDGRQREHSKESRHNLGSNVKNMIIDRV